MKKFVRALSLLLALLTLAAAVPALADIYDEPYIQTETLWARCEYGFGITFVNIPMEAKLVSVSSSNKKVLRVRKFSSDMNDTLLEPLKAGTAKVTAKYKVGSKNYTLSAVYTVKDYPNPLKSVLVDGKAIDIVNNRYYFDFENYSKAKTVIKLNLASGWKVSWTWGFIRDKNGNEKEFAPKSGKSFKIPKGGGAAAFFTLINKQGDEIQYGIRFNLG